MNTPPRILVVDDIPADRLVLARPLEKAGYEVLTADDGFKAVEAATRQKPDLILLDMMMPGQNGLEVCTILKSREDTAAVPVIFVTGVSDMDQILQAFAAGGCDYVTKPFSSEELLARVSAHVGLRQQGRKLENLSRQLAEANVELAKLSRVDPLTNLLNRRTWEEIMEQEHERFQRHGSPYSIVMIDVDRFKAFNDSYGHQAGDECLQRIAETIASVCRCIDSVGRYGGEEFVILASQTQAEQAVKLAERARKAVWMLGIPHPSKLSAGRITISLGVAAGASDLWEDALKEADDALYVAKRAGRNMVYSADVAKTSGRDATRSANDESFTSDDAGKQQSAKQASALVVDDDKTNRVFCAACLQRAGYQVRYAVDGHDALASVKEDPPDVIIMDVMMPNMDGLECTRHLKADPDTRDIPVIMVSALTETDDIRAGLEAGADEYVAKPIRPTELTLRVQSMVRLYRERADLLASYQMRGEHTRILTCLVEFCRAVGTSRNVDEALDHTLTAVAEVTYSRRVSIMFPDKEGQHLRISKSRGMDEELASSVRVPIGEPIAGQVYVSGKSVLINTEEEAPVRQEGYDSRFFASVPLLCTLLDASDTVIGVLNVTERVGGQPFRPYELEYIELIAKVAATTLHDISSREAHDRASDAIMVALAKLAEHRDNDTARHLDRVTQYCSLLARQLRESAECGSEIDEAFLHNLVRAVPLHDIGKVAIPDHILLHPGKLKPDEMEVMRTHAKVGAKTIQALIERCPGIGFLEMAADITYYHHEWYDGSGYPKGLKADAIPLSARITALADVYDALTTKRVYKNPISHDRAVAVIVEASGTQFDPAVVDAFVKHEKDFAELAVAMTDEPSQSTAVTPTSHISRSRFRLSSSAHGNVAL
ncbi:MAG: response regulator [Planctomycetota bacterium]|jgi:diguanylate cyclase (GGDEF)-like protein